MNTSFHIGAASQTALARRLESIANNVANAGTIGFRGDGVKFATTISTTGGGRLAYPSVERDYISTASGAIVQTGNALDFAVRGDCWLSLASPNGPIYTRDGRFTLAATGELQSVNGYPLLDASGAPIFLDPTAGEAAVAPDGAITQRGRQVGVIGLFVADPSARLSRRDNSSVSSDLPMAPVTDYASNGVLQGRLEQSNVDPIRELTRLIEVQRAFENITASMEILDVGQQDAIKTLGATG